MEVRELMTTEPAACLAGDSCRTAGELMRSRRCGFLPVVENHEGRRVIGVVTDRDIALHLTQADVPASRAPVKACMTANPRTVAPQTELEEAARAMEELAVHRLPVVEGGRLVGVLSVKDIALAARRQWARAGPNIPARQMTEIVEAIAAARIPSGR
jgi:CBS domain-containing protein